MPTRLQVGADPGLYSRQLSKRTSEATGTLWEVARGDLLKKQAFTFYVKMVFDETHLLTSKVLESNESCWS